MRRLLIFCLAVLLLSVGLPVSPAPSAPSAAQAVESGTTAAARAQDLLLSKGVKGENRDPDIAVDPNTGNVLVVWHRFDTGGGDVWASLLRRKGSGKYKKPRPRRLSSGDGFQFGARVAWIEANQQFFVVWERAGSDRGVLARAVNRKTGKPVGGVRTLITVASGNTSPDIAASVANGSQNITLVYTSTPNPSARRAERGGEASLNTAKVTTELEAHDFTEQMRMPGSIDIKDVLDLSTDDYSPCFLVLYDTSEDVNGDTILDTRVKLITAKGVVDLDVPGIQRGKALKRTGDSVVVSGGLFTSGTFVETLSSLEVDCKNGSLKARPSTLSGEYLFNWVLPGLGPRPSQLFKNGTIVFADEQRVYRQVLDEDLNLVGTQELLFDHRDTMTSMIGDNITLDSFNRSERLGKKSNSVLVWTKSVGKDRDQEIRAHIFYVKPFE